MGRVLAATPPSGAAAPPRGRVIPLWTWMAAGTAAAAGILAMITWGDAPSRRATDVASGPPPAAAKPATALVAREAEADAEEKAKGSEKGAFEEGVDAAPPRAEAPPVPVAVPEEPARARAPAPAPAPAPAAEGPAPDKDAPPADDRLREGERRKEDEGKAKGKAEEKAPPEARARLAVFYRTLNPADAEQRVDRVLFLHRDLALEQVGWKDAAEVESSLGRLLRDENAVAGLTAKGTRDRVLQVRLRSRDLDRLRAEFAKIESMREASTLVLLESSGRAPAEIEKAIRASLDELARKDAAGAKSFKADGAGGETAAREPGEPAPPPLPSKELLEKLAGGVSPPRAGAAGGGGTPAKPPETEEVWVEIHVVASPPPR